MGTPPENERLLTPKIAGLGRSFSFSCWEYFQVPAKLVLGGCNLGICLFDVWKKLLQIMFNHQLIWPNGIIFHQPRFA